MNKGEIYQWDHEPTSKFKITELLDNGQVRYKYIEGYSKGESFTNRFSSLVGITLVNTESSVTPTHYNDSKIDALTVIDDWKLDFRLGNTIKYIQRHTKKGNPLQDLKKAAQYLALAIKKMEEEV